MACANPLICEGFQGSKERFSRVEDALLVKVARFGGRRDYFLRGRLSPSPSSEVPSGALGEGFCSLKSNVQGWFLARVST